MGRRGCPRSLSTIGITALFYICLGILLFFLIVPHTAFWFRNSWNWSSSNRLNKDDIVLAEGGSFQLKVNTINKRISYTSSDFKVATVDIFGNITANRKGKTIVYVKYDKYVLKCRIRVVRLNHTSLKLAVNKTSKLKIQGWSGGVRWKSSNVSVVSVSRFGTVKAKKKGTATITATVKGVKMSCKIKVR